MTRRTPHRGYLMLVAIVFGAVFLATLGGLSMFIVSQNRLQTRSSANTEALAIAEAGIEYYRWHLEHFPDDLQNGTGVPGPYVIPYLDPETGEELGEATLDIEGNTACGEAISVDISSTGVTASDSSAARTVTTRYAQPSVAYFSYILNDSVWAGSDRVINGPYHSNGGVHMDGTANSPVTSSLSTWNCTSSYGCSPASSSAPGVFGTGPNQNLWEWPVPQVDFSAIAADFGSLKTVAQSDGIYYPRYSTTNGQGDPAYWRGYHLLFNANGTVTVRRVSATTQLQVTPVNSADATTDRVLINNEATYETKTIPVDCGLIFVEDNTWIEGTIPQKVTVVVANIVNANIAPNAYLRNNIQYGATDGTDGLTVIAENDVLVAPDAPTNMTVNGVFIAQGGAFGRNLYLNSSRTDCNSTYEPKTSLTILGTTVSNKRTGTKWVNGCGAGDDAGFAVRTDSYDRRLASDPPPFTPVVSTDYELMDWREE
jgi:type II secretory pathway pseudopilin PulG